MTVQIDPAIHDETATERSFVKTSFFECQIVLHEQMPLQREGKLAKLRRLRRPCKSGGLTTDALNLSRRRAAAATLIGAPATSLKGMTI